jgi:hypothetical protein
MNRRVAIEAGFTEDEHRIGAIWLPRMRHPDVTLLAQSRLAQFKHRTLNRTMGVVAVQTVLRDGRVHP